MEKITTSSTTVFKSRKTLLLVLLSFCFSLGVFAQVDISTEQQLRDIVNNKAGSYRLTADITLTSAWTPVAGFTGTFNGNGFVIKGLNVNTPTTNSVGLFATTTDATITKLGIENANLVGNADVGGIVGIATGTTISECYVANSYIEGRDHVGSIAGALKTGTTVTDSYGNAEVVSRQYQVAGIAGIIVDATINRCYFSGLVYTITGSSNVGGLVALIDGGTNNVISNSVSLAPYVLGGTVCKVLANTGGRTNTLTNNYGLDGFLKAGSLSALATIPSSDANVGADKLHGAEVTKSNAQGTSFYGTTLGWDMTNVWTLPEEGQIYPVLKWQKTPYAASVVGVSSLKKGLTIAATLTLRAYGNYGQTVNITHPATSVFAESVIDNGLTLTGAALGTVAFVATSVTKAYLTPAAVNFNVEVYDPAISAEIHNAQDLLSIKEGLARKYKLMSDIDMTAVNWLPFGTSANPFTGTLDGNGHIIKGLKYNNSDMNAVGLFAYATNATIQKLGIENANLVGNADVGGIVGIATGTSIRECYVANSYIEGRDHVGAIAGALKTASIAENCYGTAKIASRQYQVAGIAGILVDGTVNKCYFSGLSYTTSGSSNAGGIVSLIDGGTTNVISNSISMAPYHLGSTVCRILASANGKPVTLTNNYALETVLRGSSVLNLNTVPSTDANVGADKLHGASASKTQATTADFYTTTLGWDLSNIWNMLEEGQIYPTLKWQQSPVNVQVLGVTTDKKNAAVGGSATTVRAWGSLGQTLTYVAASNEIVGLNPVVNAVEISGLQQGSTAVTINSVTKSYLVSSPVTFDVDVIDPNVSLEIYTVADLVNVKNNLSRKFILMNDLNISSETNWTPIGTTSSPFTGTFDGNGYTISGLTINQASQNIQALFGVTTGATIKKLALKQVNVIGSQDVAGLVGKAIGTSISEVYVSGTIEGNDHVGAIAGGTFSGATSNITNCYSDATVSTRSSQVGGLLGVAASTNVSNSYFSGTVTAPQTDWMRNAAGIISLTEDGNVTMDNVVSTASAITGGTPHPFVSRGTIAINNSFYRADMVITGTVGNNGGNVLPDVSTQKSLSDFQNGNTYTAMGWDFTTIWTIRANAFPMLLNLRLTTDVENNKVADKYKVFVSNGVLHVQGTENAAVSVFNVNGQLVKQLQNGENQFTLNAKGVFLIRINNENTIYKVIAF